MYFIVPEHLQGFIKGLSCSFSSPKHILHIGIFCVFLCFFLTLFILVFLFWETLSSTYWTQKMTPHGINTEDVLVDLKQPEISDDDNSNDSLFAAATLIAFVHIVSFFRMIF